MAHSRYDQQPVLRTSACVAIFLLICAKTYHCASSVPNYCPLTPTILSSHFGSPVLEECTTVDGGSAFLCSIQCSASASCKAVVTPSCNLSGHCTTCLHCNKLTKVDFGMSNVQFFLHTREIGKNTDGVRFPNSQLIAGQPLLAEIFLAGTRAIFTFVSTVGHSVFLIEIRFDEGSVVANSYIGYRWGAEDRYTPHFNFHQGQTISMFCVVTSTAYELYFDRVLFKYFPHRFSISVVSDFVVNSESNIVSFRL
ncbi:galectin [Elysia marginata]|uniref:Galectin n=1 Tax=Elysia marginata TaxID=1093978 RepID=A0AAV4JUU6_9GAST|nr:galectin [Elysia marginata]